jgi:NAD(P)H-dependent FMN reductase
MAEEVNKAGYESEVIDVRDYRIVATDKTEVSPQAKKLSQKINKADGLIIVTPEYNHGYPGELKMMLDMLYDEYAKKPVGFCGVSAGGLGGARVVEQLRQVVAELHMVGIREALYFPAVQDIFDVSGDIKDKNLYQKRIAAFLEELAWYAKKLR